MNTIALNIGPTAALVVMEALSAAATTIVPGDLIERTSAGEVQEHSGAGLNAQKMFALPNLAVAGTIDDAYTAGVTVSYGIASSGQGINARVAAAATAIPDGAALESAGDGTVRILTVDAATDDTQRDAIVGYAREAVDNSGGGTVVRIEISVA